MITSISSWAKAIVLAVIIVSILEMLLPNNKTQKYIKMVMGLFILYNIISPFIKNSNSLCFEENKIEEYSLNNINSIEVNQESMDKRLEELYIKEIEKDIIKKVEKQGYKVKSCKVKAKISDNEEETGISNIYLRIEKDKNKEEVNDEDKELEDKLILKIQDIKKVNTTISENKTNESNSELNRQDIQNLKQFLIKEYEVNEKCLDIK